MNIYEDRVSLRERYVEMGYRDDSVEVNELRSNVLGKRLCLNGCWHITSCQDCGSFNDFPDPSRPILEILNREGLCKGLADANLFDGKVRLGVNSFDINEIVKLIIDLCSELRALGISKCEIIVTFRHIEKTITSSNGYEAYEERNLIEVDVGLVSMSRSVPLFGSAFTATILWKPKEISKLIEKTAKEAYDNLMRNKNVRVLSPYMIGKNVIILDSKASAALVHEISHLLDPTYAVGILKRGITIAPPEFELIDDPFRYDSPSIRFFDDELVRTQRRHLIEGGRIIDLHQTRSTALHYNSVPGSAYGLFHKPIPFHTTLILSQGDWKVDEMIEETRSGILINGVALATLEMGYIRLIPQNASIIKHGEVQDNVKVREVKIPLSNLKTINAISRELNIRTSKERDWIVTEVAPYIRLEAYVT